MKRKHLSRLAKVRIFDRAHGRCIVCGLKIHAEQGDKFEIHHVKPIWAGGTDEPWNMAPAHAKPCHKSTSDNDNTDRAKADRQRANHLGVPKASQAKLPCGRESDFRKTMSGRVVERFTQAELHRAAMRKRKIGG